MKYNKIIIEKYKYNNTNTNTIIVANYRFNETLVKEKILYANSSNVFTRLYWKKYKSHI